MIDDYDEERFIPGIYNYCDRWCERCRLTNRCFLYHRESKREAEHLAKGKDPHDWDIVLQDMFAESFQEAKKLLQKHAEEQGIDLNAIDTESIPQPPDPSEHPLNVKAHRYTTAAHKFLDKLRNIINEEIEDINTGNILPQLESANNIEEIKECFEVISWYHTLIAAKIDRALFSKMEAEQEEDEELADYSQDDADGSAKIAYDGLVKSMDALTTVHEWNRSLHDDVMPLLMDVYGLINGIDREFPGHKEFKRPGFDE